MSRITSSGSWDLKIQLWDSNGIYGESNYGGFSLGNSISNYALTLGSYSPDGPGGELTDAGDALGVGDYTSGVAFISTGADNAPQCEFTDNPGW